MCHGPGPTHDMCQQQHLSASHAHAMQCCQPQCIMLLTPSRGPVETCIPVNCKVDSLGELLKVEESPSEGTGSPNLGLSQASHSMPHVLVSHSMETPSQ